MLDELFDEDSDDDSDSDEDDDEDALSNPDSLLESADSENIKSLLSQSTSAPPTVHIHKHISFMVHPNMNNFAIADKKKQTEKKSKTDSNIRFTSAG